MKIIETVGAILHRKGSQMWTIAPEAMVFEALQMMAEKNIGAVPVVEGGRLIGIISERDYTRNVILKGRSSKATTVGEIMMRHPVTVTPSDEINECMRLMTQKRVRHLPVLDGNELVGMVSIGDLVKWIMESQEATIQQLEQYIVGGYPA